MSRPSNADRAAGRLLEPQDQAADRGLAAAGFADQPQRLARRDRRSETSSTACTVAVSAPKQRRRLDGKCLLQVATASSGAAHRWSSAPSGARRAAGASASVPAAISWRAPAGRAMRRLPIVAQRRRPRRRSSMRNGQRGAKRQPGGRRRAGRAAGPRWSRACRRAAGRAAAPSAAGRWCRDGAAAGTRRRRSPCSTMRPAYITLTRSA